MVVLIMMVVLIVLMVVVIIGLFDFDLCFIVILIAGGVIVFLYFNDFGFWLVLCLMEMDEKIILKMWIVMEIFLGGIVFLIVVIFSFIL